MKVAVISSFDHSLINFRLDLIKDLQNNGCDVHVVAPFFNENNKNKLKNYNIKTFEINFYRTKINPLLDLILIFKFYFFFKKHKFDIIFLYTAKPVIYGSIAGNLANIKSINSLITGLGHFFISKKIFSIFIKNILIILYKFSLSKNKNIIFQNNDDKNKFIDLNIINKKNNYKNIHVVNGSGVNIDFFYEMPLSNKISFLLVSRLLKEKGILEYIDACKQISKKYDNIIFYMAGWMENHLDSISKSDLKKVYDINNFKFLGKIDDVRESFKKSNIVVLPSYREGLPRIIIEAMSCGRPIITTNVPGCRETVINEKNGFLIKHKSSQSLVIAMEKFIKNPKIIYKMGKESRKLVEEKFDVKLINEKLLNILLKNV